VDLNEDDVLEETELVDVDADDPDEQPGEENVTGVGFCRTIVS